MPPLVHAGQAHPARLRTLCSCRDIFAVPHGTRPQNEKTGQSLGRFFHVSSIRSGSEEAALLPPAALLRLGRISVAIVLLDGGRLDHRLAGNRVDVAIGAHRLRFVKLCFSRSAAASSTAGSSAGTTASGWASTAAWASASAVVTGAGSAGASSTAATAFLRLRFGLAGFTSSSAATGASVISSAETSETRAAIETSAAASASGASAAASSPALSPSAARFHPLPRPDDCGGHPACRGGGACASGVLLRSGPRPVHRRHQPVLQRPRPRPRRHPHRRHRRNGHRLQHPVRYPDGHRAGAGGACACGCPVRRSVRQVPVRCARSAQRVPA